MREMVSHESVTYGEHEGSDYQGQFGDACYHPCGLLDQLGDVERCALRCCRSGGSQLPALGEMLDEVSRELRKPDRPSRPDGGRVAGGGASRRGYCGITSSLTRKFACRTMLPIEWSEPSSAGSVVIFHRNILAGTVSPPAGRCYGAAGEDGNFVAYINRWSAAMPQPNDLSRSFALDQDSTIIAVVRARRHGLPRRPKGHQEWRYHGFSPPGLP